MIGTIQFPSTQCAYNRLLTHVGGKHDRDDGERIGEIDGGGIPSPKAESISGYPSWKKIEEVNGSLGRGKI